jgi:hypothetical protein
MEVAKAARRNVRARLPKELNTQPEGIKTFDALRFATPIRAPSRTFGVAGIRTPARRAVPARQIKEGRKLDLFG